MISYLEGQLLFLEAGHGVIKTHGVGYHVLLSKSTLESLHEGQDVVFFIHTHVREDAFELYGFRSRIEKQLFLMLISVSGVGPKLALTILSFLSPNDILIAILNKDINKLSTIPGIGKKTAERLSLELKEKAQKIDLALPNEPLTEDPRKNLEQAIRGLGYSKAQSDKALFNLDARDLELPFEVLFKKTLNLLTGNAT